MWFTDKYITLIRQRGRETASEQQDEAAVWSSVMDECGAEGVHTLGRRPQCQPSSTETLPWVARSLRVVGKTSVIENTCVSLEGQYE